MANEGVPPPSERIQPEHCDAEEYIDPRELTPHPWSVQTYGLGTEDEQKAMAESVGTGVQHPLIVTGNECHSGRNIILAGCRRHLGSVAADLPTVPIKRVHGLSESQERAEIARDNLLGELARELTDYQVAVSEAALIEKYSVGQGHRTDITSVDPNRGSGSAVEIVARTTGRKLNAVRDRHKILSCQLTTPVLTEAYRSGQCSRSKAAAVLRRVEKDLADVLEQEGGLDKARAEVDRLITEQPKEQQVAAASTATPSHENEASDRPAQVQVVEADDGDHDEAAEDEDPDEEEEEDELCRVAEALVLVSRYLLGHCTGMEWLPLIQFACRCPDYAKVRRAIEIMTALSELQSRYESFPKKTTQEARQIRGEIATMKEALVDETADFPSSEAASERRITEWDRIVLLLRGTALPCAHISRKIYDDSSGKNYNGTRYILGCMAEHRLVRQNETRCWELTELGQERLSELATG